MEARMCRIEIGFLQTDDLQTRLDSLTIVESSFSTLKAPYL
jgi:hypothetical protein